MATNLATLGIKLNATQALIGLEKLDNKLKGVGLSSRQVGAKLAKFGKMAGVALGGLAIMSIKTAAGFEASMNKVAAIGGHTGDALQALENQARELGRSTEFSASQAADGMTFLAMAGFDAKQSLAAMPGVLNLASATSTDLATSADIASNILSGLGLTANKTGKLVDVMSKATSSANMNVLELGEAMKMSSPLAKTAGLSMEGMTAIIGKMADAGIKGSLAGTALKAGIVKLLKPTTEMTDALDGMGVSINNSDGSMRNFIDILADMEEAGAGATEFVTIFGQRAGPSLMAALSEGIGGIKDLRTELQNAGGTAKEMSDIQLQGLNGALKKLNSAWEDLQITFAKTGVLTELTDKVGELTEHLGKKETIEQIKEFGRGVLSVGSAIKGVFDAFMNIPEWIRDIGIVMAFLGGKKAKLVLAGITALSWGIGKIGDAISSVGDEAEEAMPKLEKFSAFKQFPSLKPFAEKQVVSDDITSPSLGNDDDELTYFEKLEEGMISFKEKFDTTWTEMADENDDVFERMGTKMAEIFGEGGMFAKSIGDAAANMLVFGEKSDLTMKKIAQSILANVVSALIQEGVQMAVNAVKDKVFATQKVATAGTVEAATTGIHAAGTAAKTTTSVTAAATETAAWTPAAMMTSLASFGTNALLAIAGIMAVSAIMKSFDGGGFTGTGSRSGGVDGKGGFMAVMHPNETVIDHTKGQSAGGSQVLQTTNEVNIDFTVNAMDSQSFQQSMMENSDLIIGVIRSAFNEQGESVAI